MRDVLQVAFSQVGLDYRDYVEIDPQLTRPAEVHRLRGDASKVRRELGWEPKVSFEELIAMMVESDLTQLAKEMPRAHAGAIS